MAVFTITLKDAIDYCADLDQTIGLDTYPIFNDEYRTLLNKKIVDHYMFREIGMESVEKFTFALRRKMNEIMPYYNQMLESERIKFDPLATFDMHTIVAGLNEGQTNASGTSNTLSDNIAKAISVHSDFPQTSLGERTTGVYATDSTESDSDAKATGSATENNSSTSKTTDMNTQRVTGFSGTAADLLTRYRATLLNIDLAILSDLQELFMSVWDNGDTYFQGGIFQ
jgi:hypothetical protein